MEDELGNAKQIIDELQSKYQTLVRENDYLKTRVEVTQQITAVTTGGTGTEKVKDLEENINKKNKDIYDLTV